MPQKRWQLQVTQRNINSIISGEELDCSDHIQDHWIFNSPGKMYFNVVRCFCIHLHLIKDNSCRASIYTCLIILLLLIWIIICCIKNELANTYAVRQTDAVMALNVYRFTCLRGGIHSSASLQNKCYTVLNCNFLIAYWLILVIQFFHQICHAIVVPFLFILLWLIEIYALWGLLAASCWSLNNINETILWTLLQVQGKHEQLRGSVMDFVVLWTEGKWVLLWGESYSSYS